MTGITITDMREYHLPEVMGIEVSSFTTPWSEKSFRNEIYNPNSTAEVAVYDGRVVGYVCAYQVLDEGHILNLATRHDMRRRGIAKEMIKNTLEQLRENGCRFVYLEVRVSNYPAISLYEGFGFKTTGIRKAYYVSPVEDAVIMRREL